MDMGRQEDRSADGMEQILFVINNTEVYKSPNSNTYM
jgi:hypothetical protein